MFKDKGSKFIGFAYPINQESDVKEILIKLKKMHYAARHWCFAWRLGVEEERYRVNDDGEPNNSAGKPIYGQIISKDLVNILVVVVRYFGGVKLGVGGLINAYKSSALEAIENTTVIEVIRRKELILRYDFSLTNEAMRIVKDQQLKVKSQDYDTGCLLTLDVRLSDYEHISTLFDKIHGIAIVSDDSEEND